MIDMIDGKYIGNGDKNLYVKILGSGEIPLVIEPDWGSLSLEWEPIQIELAKHTTVISYDRAGYGESPGSKYPRTSEQIANEINVVLANTGIEGPFIFIGHGAGGLYSQQYLKMFANNVAGVVLLDSLSIYDVEFDKLELPKYQETMSFAKRLENFQKYTELEKDDFEKNIIPMLYKVYESFPEDIRNAYITYQSEKSFYETVLNEMTERDKSIEMLSQLSMFTNVPVNILCHDYRVMLALAESMGIPEEEARVVEELWLKNSKDLENLSLNTSFSITKNYGHNMHIECPQIVIDAVLDVLKRAE